MEDLGAQLSQETLDDLSRLERRAQKLVAKQKQAAEHHSESRQMMLRIQHLQQRRDKLRNQLGKKHQTLCDELKKKEDTIDEMCPPGLDPSQVAPSLRRTKLRALQLVYRLTGISVKVVNRNTVCFCFDTSYRGQFYEPYYVEALLHPTVTISRHTLPSFLPLPKLQEKLQNDLQDFAFTTRTYLQAFIARRQAAKQIHETFAEYMAEEPAVTAACDFIKLILINLSKLSTSIHIGLVYESITSSLPTRVTVQCKEVPESTEAQDIIEDLEDHLKTNDPFSAVEEFITRVTDL